MSLAEASVSEAPRIVRRVIGSLPVRVFLFGSRALGTARPTSDIDLALLPDGAIPYPVDVVDLSQGDERFRETILREGREWAA